MQLINNKFGPKQILGPITYVMKENSHKLITSIYNKV